MKARLPFGTEGRIRAGRLTVRAKTAKNYCERQAPRPAGSRRRSYGSSILPRSSHTVSISFIRGPLLLGRCTPKGSSCYDLFVSSCYQCLAALSQSPGRGVESRR
jgi:hypothetical protein